MTQFNVEASHNRSTFYVVRHGHPGFRFPMLSEQSALNLADRANFNVASGWDWNR